ncbi:bifunctional phosphopantothenoylcysteine decarboxylase/phosphopantothenate--cysteine ligase CoaBC [Dermacoccus sp. Tok2021]|uniref:bifunctional phosphopantothenoylcysteine decarboxylase/phosphopantothenate--cysteine ligase CoaBC n=1 Tax=Dermacoccus sp. Tok2021 TaxID=2826873 RepID=UPI001CA6B853|nr:bifunctional phosphopantothenoylcysteine decarboxylase/phosphopantothenate--cysteine ligase CoaBC [Dermacoccus sp. Tok2021]MBZ4497517.1 bifunctional phosphopantothenoylcysteine decarboxylase/phosphopantothenate--cysteine ligase CoaBC [Dermacoccus sp. Tok2021]
MRIVLGVTGGIAGYKAALLLRLFTESGHDVTVVPTSAALEFVGAPTWEALSGKPVQTGVFENVHAVPHVKLGQSADLVVVAPATADLLAKAACGMANDLLTNTLLTARCPVVMAPAMHTEMWLHPATQANVATLRERGVTIVEPASGRLTGADTGPGRLPDPDVIYEAALAAAASGTRRDGAEKVPVAREQGPLAGRTVLVTAGGTREAIDPVRYLGNRSSGKMGFAIAAAAADLGAKVTLVTTVTPPADVASRVDVVMVEGARAMREKVLEAEPDLLVMAAAVADFRPSEVATSKIKKTHGAGDDSAPVITLVRNPDILAEAVAQRDAKADSEARRRVIVGFAAETGDADGDVLFHARAKLARKGCDVLVANEVGDGVTFGQDESTAHLLRADSDEVVTVGPAPKSHIAAAVVDLAASIFTTQ